MKNLKPTFLMLGILMAVFSTSGQEKILKVFNDVDEIELSVSSGDAIFKKSSSDEISIELEHTYTIDYDPEFRKSGSKLDISDRNVGRKYNNYSGSATWTFYIPDDMEIEFKTGSGDVEITGLTMEEFQMNSGSGDCDIREFNGEIEINTGSGDIEISNATGELEMNTGSGSIELDQVVAAIRANTGSGDVEAEGVELSDRSSFNSGSGDVDVTLAKTANFDISVNSGSGDATLDFDGNAMEGTLVMEVNKDRGRIRAPFDFDSEEEIGEGRNTKLKKTKKLSDKDVQIRVNSGSGTAEVTK